MNEEMVLQAKILIIDDADANLKLLEALLSKEGFTQMISTTEAKKAIELFNAFEPDLVLLDLMMPEMDGYQVLGLLQQHIPSDVYLPVLVLTADTTIAAKRKALALGAKDFLTKPFDHIETMLRIWNLLETRLLYKQLKQYQPDLSPVSINHS